MVRSFTSATRRTRSSWRPGRASPGRSKPSLSVTGPSPPRRRPRRRRVRPPPPRAAASRRPARARCRAGSASGPCGQSSGSSEMASSASWPSASSRPALISPGRDHGLHRVGGHAGVPGGDLPPVDRQRQLADPARADHVRSAAGGAVTGPEHDRAPAAPADARGQAVPPGEHRRGTVLGASQLAVLAPGIPAGRPVLPVSGSRSIPGAGSGTISRSAARPYGHAGPARPALGQRARPGSTRWPGGRSRCRRPG